MRLFYFTKDVHKILLVVSFNFCSKNHDHFQHLEFFLFKIETNLETLGFTTKHQEASFASVSITNDNKALCKVERFEEQIALL